ncbi:MAG: UDP-3-O-(3-hydroxymyristoyl)glucosamine N-acyltransferase [Deferribacteres bacterium]|nr:UDP-3-O-(3-hydroxymyristoyl)glucosamine N-acyltransferase [Deferribacteres bacterium]
MVQTASDIARIVGGELIGDASEPVKGVSSLDEAKEGELSFVTEEYYRKNKVINTRASVLIVPKGFPPLEGKTLIAVDDPMEAVIKVLHLFVDGDYGSGISPYAVVSPSAKLGENVVLREFVVVEDGAVIEDDAVVMPFCYIGKNAVVGKGSILFPHVVVYRDCVIGKKCVIHAGAVIGADGFGYIEVEGRRVKIPQIGRVVIEDNVEVGANTCIDRATLGSTRVGEGTKLDNLVQIGHNVKIGRNTVIAGQTGIAGSVKVGDGVMMGGQVGVADHVKIGDRVMIAAKSGVTGNLKDGEVVIGSPAMPVSVWKRIYGAMKKLPEIYAFFRKLKAKGLGND